MSRDPVKLSRVVKGYFVDPITPLIALAQTIVQDPDFRIHGVSISQSRGDVGLSAARTVRYDHLKMENVKIDLKIEQHFGVYCFGIQNHFRMLKMFVVL